MNTELIVALFVAVLGSNGLWTFVQFLAGRKKAKINPEDIEEFKNGLCALLRNEIVVAHRTYTSQGFCTIEDKTNISEMYKAYHKLGGNDIATALKNQIMELPNDIKKEGGTHGNFKQGL